MATMTLLSFLNFCLTQFSSGTLAERMPPAVRLSILVPKSRSMGLELNLNHATAFKTSAQMWLCYVISVCDGHGTQKPQFPECQLEIIQSDQ